jgi:hypothetical protein
MTRRNSANLLWAFTSLMTMVLLSGCNSRLRTEYGQSRGVEGDESINGFGVLRRAYENSGWTTRDVHRLNNRLTSVDAIVWIPEEPDTLYDAATQWFDQWLAESKRTLVYIVPDEGRERQYFEAAMENAPVAQRLEYRRHLARIESDQLQERLGEEAIPSNGWFTAERLPAETMLSVSGAKKEVPVSYKVVPIPLTTTAQAQTNPTPVPKPTSFWFSYGQSSAEVKHTTLYQADDGSPVVVRITSPDWGDSQLIVVGGGSILSNYSLATSQGQSIAQRLISETGDMPGNVGLLTTDFRGASVSDVDPEINSLTGMELFTVWPLNLIILNLAVIGFVCCMILLPIFGRPRSADTKSSSDFADHLDAVAALMQRSGGESFARRRVSDYMKRIRGETIGPWVLPDSKPIATSSIVHPVKTDEQDQPEPLPPATKETF